MSMRNREHGTHQCTNGPRPQSPLLCHAVLIPFIRLQKRLKLMIKMMRHEELHFSPKRVLQEARSPFLLLAHLTKCKIYTQGYSCDGRYTSGLVTNVDPARFGSGTLLTPWDVKCPCLTLLVSPGGLTCNFP